MGNRPGKRMFFDNTEYEDIIGGLQEQIKRKREAKINEYLETNDYYNKLLTDRQEKILDD